MLKKNLGEQRESKIKSPKKATYINEFGKKMFKRKGRGGPRYFCFIQYRYSDIYCFLESSIGVPAKIKNNFDIKDCLFVDKDLEKVKDFLKSLSIKFNKDITFSLDSIKINL